MGAPLAFLALSAAAAPTPRGVRRIHRELGDPASRLAAVSGQFLGIPYKLGPMGEGPGGRFDRGPLWTFDDLDCTTFVEEALALALDADYSHALKVTLQDIRYKGGRVDYVSRNHFPEADWTPNNVAAGFLEDITQSVGGADVRVATKTISKSRWYAGKKLEDLRGFDDETREQKEKRLADWRAAGAGFQDEVSAVAYVPIEKLAALWGRVPSGTIGNLVRADQPDKPVLISHQILLVRARGVLYVRHAAQGRAVEDAPAATYFDRFRGSAWPLLGLNLLRPGRLGQTQHNP